MNRKPSLFDRFTKFVSGKGFYLVVLICVAAIGISGYYLMRSIAGAGQEESVAAISNTQIPEASSDVEVQPSESPTQAPVMDTAASESPSASPSEAPSEEPSATPEATATTQPAALVFTWPVNGSIITSFSMETLLYDQTMLDWRTHDGIDLAASVGTRVLATAAGTVTQVYEDELMGMTVVIDHGDGLESVYSNLSSALNVDVGDSVYTGDIIGTVGDTAVAESGLESHLHFAMYQDDLPVNPEDYLPDV